MLFEPAFYLTLAAVAISGLYLAGYYGIAFSGLNMPHASTILVENRKNLIWPALLTLAWAGYFGVEDGNAVSWGAFAAACILCPFLHWLGGRRAMENLYPALREPEWEPDNPRTSKLDPGDRVAGVLAGGKAYALPLAQVARHHIVEMKAGGVRLIVTHCALTGSTSVYESKVGEEDARFHLGAPNYNNFLMRDDLTGTWWSQMTGQPIVARGQRWPLRRWPCMTVSLSRWRQIHTNSQMLKPAAGEIYDYEAFRVKAAPAQDAQGPEGKNDESRKNGSPLGKNDRVYGIFDGQDAVAVGMDFLRKQGVVEFEAGESHLLVAYDDYSDNAVGFVKELRNPVEPRFECDPNGLAAAIDTWSNSQLDFSGRFFKGSLTDKRLPLASGTEAYWGVWSKHFPQTRLICEAARESAEPSAGRPPASRE